MDRSRRSERIASCAALLLFATTSTAQDTASAFSNVERVIAFADVHGAHDELVAVLRTAGVVDADLHWSAGKAHVVSTGDLLDRGPGSRKALDLVMRLQTEARTAGGALHVTLGNHEAMNLLGDLRYATPEEFASYASDESADVRQRARQGWQNQHGAGSVAEFEKRFPPGYFGQRAALAPEGLYGRWLLGLPVAVVVNDTLFMHGGPSPVLSGLSIEEVNRRYRSALAGYLSALAELASKGLVLPEDSFEQRAVLARKRLESKGAQDPAARGLQEAVRRFEAADRDPFISSDGPNWYRGAALCNEASERDVLDPLLGGLKVKRLVIGHTVTRTLRVVSRFDGVVTKLDTGMNRAAYRGHPAALVIDRDGARVLYAEEDGRPSAIQPEGVFVSAASIDEATVATILEKGTVTLGAARADKSIDATVEHEGRRVPALFVEASPDALRKELAAYQLDQLLQLGLVPATVKREVNGRAGILQARSARWVTQADVEQQAAHPGGWCSLEPQFQLMYTFDALIGNEGRTRERMLFDISDWMLMLTGHDKAFGTSRSLPRHLKAHPPQPGAEMRRRLAKLDAATLKSALGDLLSDRERAALVQRRDALVRTALPQVAAR